MSGRRKAVRERDWVLVAAAVVVAVCTLLGAVELGNQVAGVIVR